MKRSISPLNFILLFALLKHSNIHGMYNNGKNCIRGVFTGCDTKPSNVTFDIGHNLRQRRSLNIGEELIDRPVQNRPIYIIYSNEPEVLDNQENSDALHRLRHHCQNIGEFILLPDKIRISVQGQEKLKQLLPNAKYEELNKLPKNIQALQFVNERMSQFVIIDPQNNAEEKQNSSKTTPSQQSKSAKQTTQNSQQSTNLNQKPSATPSTQASTPKKEESRGSKTNTTNTASESLEKTLNLVKATEAIVSQTVQSSAHQAKASEENSPQTSSPAKSKKFVPKTEEEALIYLNNMDSNGNFKPQIKERAETSEQARKLAQLRTAQIIYQNQERQNQQTTTLSSHSSESASSSSSENTNTVFRHSSRYPVEYRHLPNNLKYFVDNYIKLNFSSSQLYEMSFSEKIELENKIAQLFLREPFFAQMYRHFEFINERHEEYEFQQWARRQAEERFQTQVAQIPTSINSAQNLHSNEPEAQEFLRAYEHHTRISRYIEQEQQLYSLAANKSELTEHERLLVSRVREIPNAFENAKRCNYSDLLKAQEKYLDAQSYKQSYRAAISNCFNKIWGYWGYLRGSSTSKSSSSKQEKPTQFSSSSSNSKSDQQEKPLPSSSSYSNTKLEKKNNSDNKEDDDAQEEKQPSYERKEEKKEEKEREEKYPSSYERKEPSRENNSSRESTPVSSSNRTFLVENLKLESRAIELMRKNRLNPELILSRVGTAEQRYAQREIVSIYNQTAELDLQYGQKAEPLFGTICTYADIATYLNANDEIEASTKYIEFCKTLLEFTKDICGGKSIHPIDTLSSLVKSGIDLSPFLDSIILDENLRQPIYLSEQIKHLIVANNKSRIHDSEISFPQKFNERALTGLIRSAETEITKSHLKDFTIEKWQKASPLTKIQLAAEAPHGAVLMEALSFQEVGIRTIEQIYNSPVFFESWCKENQINIAQFVGSPNSREVLLGNHQYASVKNTFNQAEEFRTRFSINASEINKRFNVAPETLLFQTNNIEQLQFKNNLLSTLESLNREQFFEIEIERSYTVTVQQLTNLTINLVRSDNLESAHESLGLLKNTGRFFRGLCSEVLHSISDTIKSIPIGAPLAVLLKKAEECTVVISWPIKLGVLCANICASFSQVADIGNMFVQAWQQEDTEMLGQASANAFLFVKQAGIISLIQKAAKAAKSKKFLSNFSNCFSNGFNSKVEDNKKNKQKFTDSRTSNVIKVQNMTQFFEMTDFGKSIKDNCEATKFFYQGKRIYRVNKDTNNRYLKDDCYFYLDALHLDHIEVFYKKKIKYVLNLDGTLNKDKTYKALSENRKI